MNLKKELSGVADAVTKIMDEALKGNQHKIDANKNGKVDAHDFKLLRSKKKVEEASAKPDFLDLDKDGDKKEPMKKASSQMKKENVEDLDEGKMKELSMDLKGLGHDAFHKKYGNPKHRYDPTNFKKPVEPGKGMDRAKALAQRGMASLTKEEQEFIDELNKSTLGSYVKKAHRSGTDNSFDHGDDEHRQYGDSDDTEREKEMQDRERAIANREKGVGRAVKRLTKEDITKTATGYIHHARPGVYGGSAKEKHVVDTLRGPKKSEIEAIEKEKKMKKSFSEMLDLINSQGLKALSEMIKEEPDNETFTKELKDQEAKAAGKKKQPDIAKGSVQAVKVEEDVEQLDELSPKTLGSYIKKAHRSGTDHSFDHGDDEHRQDGDPDDTEREKEMQDRERAIDNRQKGVGRAIKRLTKEDVTVKKDYDDNEQSEHGVYKGKKQIGYVVHNKKENTHTAYHGPQGRGDFGHIDDFPDHNKAVSQIKKSAGIKEDIQERSLTEPEMKKKEDIVKSMKKGLSGFKARYGKDAKSVMYATATKRAMGENVEQIDEVSKKPDSHGVVILKKTHEVPSHVVHGEQGKNYTLHLHDVYHQKPGKKEKKLGQIESNIHNKDDENEAHIVSRHKDGEDFHMETHHAIEHLMNMHKIHSNTPIKNTKAPNFKKGSTDGLPDYL